MAHDAFRDLPAVSRLLAHPRSARLLGRFNRDYVVSGCRAVLGELRQAIGEGRPVDASTLQDEAIISAVETKLHGGGQAGLQRVVNATGTVLHTNLGRALLPEAAVQAVVQAAREPVTLEYDLGRGERGRREAVVEELLTTITGAEAATVVNNNAAAVFLVLNTLAAGRDVIVSRGELIEIGGSFRIPEIMARTGATLREVGTTNRTHRRDYENAITDRTGLLLKVHTSNYRIVGFAADVPLAELVEIGAARGIPVVEDLGSGALIDLGAHGLPKEPVVAERVALGADVVTFSGDKVLGGPQAGLIAGRARWLREIAANPLHRAVRCGKLTIAALEAVLRLYRESPDVVRDVPALRAFTRSIDEIDETARRALPGLAAALGPGFRVSVEDGASQVGSGALPAEEIPTKVIAVAHDTLAAHHIAERFRRARPPILGRISDDVFLLDARTIFDPLELVPQWAGTQEAIGPLDPP